MSILKTIVPKPERRLISEPRRRVSHESRQRELMVGSLCLLLLALSIVIWHDRDFWFPDSEEAETDQPVQSAPPTKPAPVRETAAAPTTTAPGTKPVHKAHSISAKAGSTETTPAAVATTAPPVVATNRTVLPPLEVEVIAGDHHRKIRPGSNSLHVDLQPGTPAQPAADAIIPDDTETAANVTNSAADRVQMSADASAVVTSPVRPNYPTLARQMKVQGSVVLQALIGRDGIIQNLRVVSGPHILAAAAEDAVRQWRFKPHYEGSEAVETQAKITVNFTISTN